MFSSARPLQPSDMFESKAGAYQSETPWLARNKQPGLLGSFVSYKEKSVAHAAPDLYSQTLE